jgi:enterochelin esterase-like enzyme
MLNYQGGTSIGVYPPNTKGAKTKARELLQNNRANYIAKADYSNSSETDQIVKSILSQISLKASVKQYTEYLLIGRSFGGVYSLMLELSQAFLMPLLMRNKYWVLVV